MLLLRLRHDPAQRLTRVFDAGAPVVDAGAAGEMDDGLLAEKEAIALATRLMRTNQYECFHLEGTRAAIRAAAKPY